MARELVLGNQITSEDPEFCDSLCMAFTPYYQLSDIYFPGLGQSLVHPNFPWEIGIQIQNQYVSLGEEKLTSTLKYRKYSLVTNVKIDLPKKNLLIQCHDCVSYQRPFYLKKFILKNIGKKSLDIRLYFQQYPNFPGKEQISAYIDKKNSILRIYTPGTHIIAGGAVGRNFKFKEFSIHSGDNAGKDTLNDFRINKLNNRFSTIGYIVSTGFALDVKIPPGKSKKVWYFLLFARNEQINLERFLSLKKYDLSMQIKKTHQYWTEWTKVHLKRIKKKGVKIKSYGAMYCRSILTLRTHSDNSGAIFSGLDSDSGRGVAPNYNYCWPFEAAIMARAWQIAGYQELSFAFLKYCHKILANGTFTPFQQRYTAQGHVAPSDFHVQKCDLSMAFCNHLGAVIWCLWKHFVCFRDISLRMRKLFFEMLLPAATWLSSITGEDGLLPPTLDVHERYFALHSSTAAAVFAGLKAAAKFCKFYHLFDLEEKYKNQAEKIKLSVEKHFWHQDFDRFLRMREVRKNGTLNTTISNLCLKIDSSVFYLYFFEMFPIDDPKMESTLNILFDVLKLKTNIGGFINYQEEGGGNHYGGNEIAGPPFLKITLWEALWKIGRANTRADLATANENFNWLSYRAMESKILGEQFDPYSGISHHLAPSPLAHAWYIIALSRYIKKMRQL
ncbi:hypothetical protein ACFL35_13905 [Candidatus Riflebacteria bacterium]